MLRHNAEPASPDLDYLSTPCNRCRYGGDSERHGGDSVAGIGEGRQTRNVMDRNRTEKEFLRLYNSLEDNHPRKLDALEKYAKFCGHYNQMPDSEYDNVILISHENNADLQAQRVRKQQRYAQAKAKEL